MKFRILRPSHYSLLKPYFENQPFKQSLFSLANIIIWRDEDDFVIRFAIDNETLYMSAKSNERPQKNHLALPLPTDNYTPEDLSKLARDLGFCRYSYVPEDYLKRYRKSQVERVFVVTEQKIFKDYIYLTEDLAELAGHRFSKKRNLIHQFERKYDKTNRVQVEPITKTLIPECVDFLERWFEARDGTDAIEMPIDKRAALNAFKDFAQLELEGVLVRIDGEVSALGTSTRLTGKIGMLNIEMAFAHFKGLYQFLDRECARRLFLGRFKYVNKESDMGLVGLRQSKRSYHPVERVKCFKLTVEQE